MCYLHQEHQVCLELHVSSPFHFCLHSRNNTVTNYQSHSTNICTEHGLSIPIILKFSIFTKLILARGFPILDRCVHWKHKNNRFESLRMFIGCKECIYYHSWYNSEYTNFFHKRTIYIYLFRILLTRGSSKSRISIRVEIFLRGKILFFFRSWKKNFLRYKVIITSFISTHRKLHFSFFPILHTHTLYFTHIYIFTRTLCEYIKLLSSMVYIYIEISSKILPYRLYDVTFHNILLCGNVFVSVLMLVCTLVCTYVTAWNTIIINTLDKRW